ncbi:MAG: GIY-YIG nuclease family protein [Pseudomonadota bacterium]|nr:GIY-YIG nuclease family protein [Pseudomonadota bacterium]
MPDSVELPAVPGAYVLIMESKRPIPVAIGSLPETTLPPGQYAYVGSARGPGGIRARVTRHLRRDKKLHWHIDRITTATEITDIRTYPGGDECGLVAKILAHPGAHHPIIGFGSSDCRNCASHFVALD